MAGPIKVTEKTLGRLAGSPKGTQYTDAELANFVVSVVERTSAAGRKIRKISFHYRYINEAGRRRSMKLGTWGVNITLEQAKRAAGIVAGRVLEGGDPALEKRMSRAAAAGVPTLAEWCETYLREVKSKKKRPDVDERYLPTAVRAIGATRTLKEIAREDIARYHQSFADTPAQGNRALASLRACLSEARRRGFIAVNPALEISPHREAPPRSRVYSDEEIKKIWAAAQDEAPVVVAAFALMITTGARLGEVLGARWTDVNLESRLWTLPDPKSGRPAIKPLVPEVVELLKRLPKKSLFVVAGRSPAKRRADLNGPWTRVRAKAGIVGGTLHDIRRTAGLAFVKSMGIKAAAVLLGHSSTQVTDKVYSPLAAADLAGAVEKVAEVITFTKRSAG